MHFHLVISDLNQEEAWSTEQGGEGGGQGGGGDMCLWCIGGCEDICPADW